MAFWTLCKNGNLVKSKKGEFVDRIDYDEIVRQNHFLKKDLDLRRWGLLQAYLVDNLNLPAIEQLAVSLYFNGLQFFIGSLANKNQLNYDNNLKEAEHK